MLDGLFVTPAATAIAEALGDLDGTVAVVGDAKLAHALAVYGREGPARKRTVIAVALPPRAAKKNPTALADLSTVESASLAAVVGIDITTDDNWAATLRGWAAVVRDGGAVVLVDKGHATEASRRALCAGLSELEQRHAGRAVITSGLVTHL